MQRRLSLLRADLSSHHRERLATLGASSFASSVVYTQYGYTHIAACDSFASILPRADGNEDFRIIETTQVYTSHVLESVLSR